MSQLSNLAMELLEGMIGVGAIDEHSAVNPADLANALHIRDGAYIEWFRELVEEELVIRILPQSIRDQVRYYVDPIAVSDRAVQSRLALAAGQTELKDEPADDRLVTEDGDHIIAEDRGYRVAEDGSRRVTEDGSFRVTEESARSAFDESAFDREAFNTGDAIKSAAWTGLAREGILTPEAVIKLKTALAVVDNALEHTSATNEEKAQARAYIIALHALAESPDPPADLIWKLIVRAGAIAGIGQLFVALLELYK